MAKATTPESDPPVQSVTPPTLGQWLDDLVRAHWPPPPAPGTPGDPLLKVAPGRPGRPPRHLDPTLREHAAQSGIRK